MIEFTAACGAEIKNIAPQQLVDAANRNTRTLFNIK